MKLSELVAYRTMLDAHVPADVGKILHKHLAPLMHFVSNQGLQFPRERYGLEQSLARVTAELATFDHMVHEIRDGVQKRIESMHVDYFAKSYRLYSDSIRREPIEWVLDREPNLDAASRELLLARIQVQSDWRRPGLILRPAREDWITHLVALDPLYLVDTDHALLAPALQRFNPQYQRRLRPYVIRESEDGVESLLPSGQIGYVLAYNFFQYKPFEIMKFYLQELHRVMAPGSILHFTFNDCDRHGAVDLVERNFMCYQPGGIVQSAVESLGFEFVDRHEIDAATTWIEFLKPGDRRTLRGGQTLATLIDKSQKPH